MNVFIVVLMFLLTAGFYFLDSPSSKVAESEFDYAAEQSDLRAIAECAVGSHTAMLRGFEFDDICLEQYGVRTEMICLSERMTPTDCEIVRNKKPAYSYVITAAQQIPENYYNKMLTVLDMDYPDSGAFGIFTDDLILGGTRAGKRDVPAALIKSMDLAPGQLVYLTQFDMPDIQTDYASDAAPTVQCPPGTVAVYRFGRWQCTPENTKTTCAGDYIWDIDLGECVPDNARRPLCDSRQTAVIVDDVWQCVDPYAPRECPAGYIARLNYSNLAWECHPDPSMIANSTKCKPTGIGSGARGLPGMSTVLVGNRCTDCEKMVTDPDTCETQCVPDTSKLSDPKCYPSAGCDGAARAFYFGFPSATYATRVASVSAYRVPIDDSHSQNRKFNCMDCGDGRIDSDRSLPPFIAICE